MCRKWNDFHATDLSCVFEVFFLSGKHKRVQMHFTRCTFIVHVVTMKIYTVRTCILLDCNTIWIAVFIVTNADRKRSVHLMRIAARISVVLLTFFIGLSIVICVCKMTRSRHLSTRVLFLYRIQIIFSFSFYIAYFKIISVQFLNSIFIISVSVYN